MDIFSSLKKIWILNNNNILMDNYKYLTKEDQEQLEEKLLEVYNLNSSINYTNSSYIFPYQLLLNKSKTYNNVYNYYKNKGIHPYSNENKFLLLDLRKINEELSIHYNVLNKIERIHPETIEIIEREKSKIKDYFKVNFSCIKSINEKITNYEATINKIAETSIDFLIETEKKYKKIKNIIKHSIPDNNEILNIDESEALYKKYSNIRYKLDVFFNSQEGEEYILKFIEEIKSIERKVLNDNYNPIPEVKNIIGKAEFINYYSSYWERIKKSYHKALKIKYDYLKKHPIKEEIYNLRQDYQSYTLYLKYIEEDLNKKIINNKIDKYFYDYINEYSVLPNSILHNSFPSTLSLFFAYYSDTLDEWFKNDMENINEYINYLILYNNIKFRYPLKMSRETYLYLYEYESVEYESIRRTPITNLHKEVVKEKGLNWSILKGIEEITLDNSDTSKNILSLFSLSDNITISKDVKSITIKNIKDFPSGNIIFQDGIEIINMKDVSFQDEITITIPKSVSILNLDYSYGNISTLIFEDYDQSPLINKKLIKNIVEEYYNLSPKIKNTYWKDEVIIDTNSHKSIKKIIMKKDNQVLEYCFHPILLENNNSILHLINTARRIVYEEICKIFIKTDKLLSNTSSEEDYPLFTSDDNNMEKSNKEYNSKNKKYIYQRK